MRKILNLRLLVILFTFLIPSMDTSNASHGLSRVCGCQVEIIAVSHILHCQSLTLLVTSSVNYMVYLK